jgi:Sec-independent protein translocase protein TatA
MVIRNKTIKKKKIYRIKNTKSVKKGGASQRTNAANNNECFPEKINIGTNKQKAKMRFNCTRYCTSKPSACGGIDEFGEEQKMEDVCKKLNVCPNTTKFTDIPKNIKAFINEMQKTLNGITGVYKSRETPESKAKKQAKKTRLQELLEELKQLQEEFNKRSENGELEKKCYEILGKEIKKGFDKFEQLEDACERGEKPDFKVPMKDLVECVDLYKDLLNRYGEIKNEINESKLQPGIMGTLKRFGSKFVSRESKARRRISGTIKTGFKRKSIKEQCKAALQGQA